MTPEAQAIKEGGVFPEFFTRSVLNKSETDEKGYPVFNDREFVKIHIAGDNKSVTERRVSDEDRKRWPTIYEHFKKTGEMSVEGYPLEKWPLLERNQVERLKYISVYTVEQLISLDDNGLQAYGPGGRELQEKAKAFMDQASGNKDYAKLAKENQQLKDDNEFMKKQIADLDDRLQRLQGCGKAKPGPKPKKK